MINHYMGVASSTFQVKYNLNISSSALWFYFRHMISWRALENKGDDRMKKTSLIQVLKEMLLWNTALRGGAFTYFVFLPRAWGDDLVWRAYFSTGLKSLCLLQGFDLEMLEKNTRFRSHSVGRKSEVKWFQSWRILGCLHLKINSNQVGGWLMFVSCFLRPIFVNHQNFVGRWVIQFELRICFNWIGSKTGLKTITINQLIQKVERSITFFSVQKHLDGMPRCWSFSSFPVPTTRSMWFCWDISA